VVIDFWRPEADAAVTLKSPFLERLLPLVREPDEAVALLDELVMSSTEAAIVVTDLEGQIVLWNAGASRLYGVSPSEAIGRSSATILQPDADLADTLETVLRDGKWEGTATSVTPAGEQFTARLVTTLRHNSAGELVGFVFMSRDITNELCLRAELRAAQLYNAELGEQVHRKTSELAQGQRDAYEASQMKSVFLANMSHELRTPLNGIIGFSELLFDGRVGSLEQQHQQFLGHILTSSRHLLQLVNDILDLAKVDAGQMVFAPERVDLDRLARQVREVLRTMSTRKGQQVRIEIDPAMGPVVADVGRLKQVLYNYLSNAIKFTPEGGRITIRLQPIGDAMFRLSVEDTGIGMKSDDLGRLFVKFEQLDASTTKLHQGTGLGLALTKRIVEAQGGMVAVQSTLGSGSTFSAVLPRQLTQDNVMLVRPDTDAASLHGPTILVVEDEPGDLQFLQRTFSQAGYVVEIATTLAAALARSQERSFQAIMLDLTLPDGGGLDLVDAIRAGGPNISTPVLVISGPADEGIAAGFPIHGYVSKPLVPEVLVEALARIGSGATILVLSDDPDNRETMAECLRDRGYRPIYAASGGAAAFDQPEIPAAVVVDPSMLSGRAVGSFRRRASDSVVQAPILAWAGNRMPAAERAQLDLSLRSIVLSGPK
jgi:PAS domain S-box-containing protein